MLCEWLGCDLIVGVFSDVPIKRGVVKAISAATFIGKGKEKKIKQKIVMKAGLEGSVEGTEAGLETKKRKTAKSRKQLVVSEEPKGVEPSTRKSAILLSQRSE